jgi:hypothetical protein
VAKRHERAGLLGGGTGADPSAGLNYGQCLPALADLIVGIDAVATDFPRATHLVARPILRGASTNTD